MTRRQTALLSTLAASTKQRHHALDEQLRSVDLTRGNLKHGVSLVAASKQLEHAHLLHSRQGIQANLEAKLPPLEPEVEADMSFHLAQPLLAPQLGEVIGAIRMTVASLTTAEGPGLQLAATGKRAGFTITTCDKHGSRRNQGGDRFVLEADHKMEWEVTDVQDGSYLAEFTVADQGAIGRLNLSVTLRDQHIKGSPFAILLKEPGELTFDRHIAAQLNGPIAAAECDETHNVYVAEYRKNRVSEFKADGTFVRHYGGVQGNAFGELHSPIDVLVVQKTLYISEYSNHRVSVFQTVDGSFVRHIGSQGMAAGQLDHPFGLCASEDELFVADSGNHRVSVFRLPDGIFLRHISSGPGNRPVDLNGPVFVSVTAQALYIVEESANRVSVFNKADGSLIRYLGVGKGSGDGQLHNPRAVDVRDGLVFVMDATNNRVSIFSEGDGSFLRHMGSKGSGPLQFNNPYYLRFQGQTLYVGDYGNNRIAIFKL